MSKHRMQWKLFRWQRKVFGVETTNGSFVYTLVIDAHLRATQPEYTSRVSSGCLSLSLHMGGALKRNIRAEQWKYYDMHLMSVPPKTENARKLLLNNAPNVNVFFHQQSAHCLRLGTLFWRCWRAYSSPRPHWRVHSVCSVYNKYWIIHGELSHRN